MTSESVSVFGTEEQNTSREFITYDAHGTVERVQYIDADLRRFIQIVENAVCTKIGKGVRNPSWLSKPVYRPLELSPRLLRTRTRRKPAPEARSWVWLFLKHHPDTRLTYRAIGKLYGYGQGTVWPMIMEIEYALAARGDGDLLLSLQSIADILANTDYERVDVRDWGRVA